MKVAVTSIPFTCNAFDDARSLLRSTLSTFFNYAAVSDDATGNLVVLLTLCAKLPIQLPIFFYQLQQEVNKVIRHKIEKHVL